MAKIASLSMIAALAMSSFASTAFANGNGGGQETCETHTLQVNLIPGDPTLYNLEGELCWKGSKENKPVQVLVHGATYDRSYWNFPGEGNQLSYVKAAVKEKYVTFAYDRLGSGVSAKPLGILVNVDNSAYVNHQVIQALRAGTFGTSFDEVVLVGHSFGSLIAVASASTYPADVDALVLTGFAHQATAQANAGTQASVYPASFDPKFATAGLDEFYFTTVPGTRAGLFFSDFVKAATLALDEEKKDLMTLGLVLDIPRHFSTESLAITAPVYMIMGSEDYLYCGENVDCSDNDSYEDYEEGFFSSSVDTKVVKKAGHSLNLHKSSKDAFKAINKWIDHNL